MNEYGPLAKHNNYTPTCVLTKLGLFQSGTKTAEGNGSIRKLWSGDWFTVLAACVLKKDIVCLL